MRRRSARIVLVELPRMPKAKIRMEHGVPAALCAYPKVWNIHVNLVLIAGVVVRAEPEKRLEAPDGIYELRYQFAGRDESRPVRVERGDLLEY